MKTKLSVFKEVATQLSFTKAADNLSMSQPAISKTIKALEDHYNKTFFVRAGNSIELTQEGAELLEYTNQILALYADLDDHFTNPESLEEQQITCGASTTLAQYILPRVLARLQKKYVQTNISLLSANTDRIEQMITNRQLDFGIIEGKNNKTQLHYTPFIKDEIVLVTNSQNPMVKSGVVAREELAELPIIERENGSGTKAVIYEKLNELGIQTLNSNTELNSSEAIKHYLYHSNKFSLLSVYSVQEDLMNNKLRIIDIDGVSFERWFYFVCRQGYHSKLMDYFVKLVRQHHN